MHTAYYSLFFEGKVESDRPRSLFYQKKMYKKQQTHFILGLKRVCELWEVTIIMIQMHPSCAVGCIISYGVHLKHNTDLITYSLQTMTTAIAVFVLYLILYSL